MSRPASSSGDPMRAQERGLATAPRPTRRGAAFLIAAIVLFFVAHLTNARELAYAACFALVVPLGSLAFVALRRLQLQIVRRISPEMAEADEPASVTLRVSNLSTLPSPSVRWIDPLDGHEVEGAASVLASMRGHRPAIEPTPPSVDARYDLSSPVRGVHAFGPVEIRVTDPFGMVTRTLRFGRPERVTIVPRVWPLGHAAVELAAGSGNERYAGALGLAGDVDVLTRKYQTGDSMRRVNWPATARFGELMVRQDDQNGAREALVLVDSDPASYPGCERHLLRQDDVEWAISAACSIGVAALADGYSLGLASTFEHPSSPRRTLRIYAPGDGGRLLLDAAGIRRVAPASGTGDLAGLVASAYGASAPTVFAVLGACSPASAVADLAHPGTGAFALIVEPEGGDLPAHPALDLEHELTAAGWHVRLARASEPFTDVWRGLISGRSPS